MTEPVKVTQTADDVSSTIRNVVTLIGGALVTNGVVQDSDVQMYTGIATALATILFSFWNNRKKNKKVEDALNTTPPSQPPAS